MTGEGECPHTGMKATGVPPTAKQAAKMKALEEQVKLITIQQQQQQEEHFERINREITSLKSGTCDPMFTSLFTLNV